VAIFVIAFVSHAWFVPSHKTHNISICNEENRLFALTKSRPSSMYIKLNLSLRTKESHLFAQTKITNHQSWERLTQLSSKNPNTGQESPICSIDKIPRHRIKNLLSNSTFCQ